MAADKISQTASMTIADAIWHEGDYAIAQEAEERVQRAEKEVLKLARSWHRFSHTPKLLDACKALQAADKKVPND